jgi:hypothetical protein
VKVGDGVGVGDGGRPVGLGAGDGENVGLGAGDGENVGLGAGDGTTSPVVR